MASEQKSVKVYARISPPTGGAEELVVVGRSHPGEIRMLRKNGLAEWVDGKVILNMAPSPKELTTKFNEWLGDPSRVQRGFPVVGSVLERVRRDVEAWREETRKLVALRAEIEGAEVDPEDSGDLVMLDEMIEEIDAGLASAGVGFFKTGSFTIHPETGVPVPTETLAPPPKETVCADAEEWFREIAFRRKAGRNLMVADNPMKLMIGFVDDDANEVFYLRIVRVKTMREADSEPMREFGLTHEMIRECLRSPAGRWALLGAKESNNAALMAGISELAGLDPSELSVTANGPDLGLDPTAPDEEDDDESSSDPFDTDFWRSVANGLRL